MSRRSLALLLGAFAFLDQAVAGTLSFEALAKPYGGSEWTIDLRLTTSDTLDGNGKYQILSLTGSYMGDAVTGLSNRVGDYHNLAPDNAISTRSDDAGNGCAGGSWFTGPHISCNGIAFTTVNGTVNLAFLGATWGIEDYAGNWTLAQASLNAIPQAIPEPTTWALALLGAGSLFAVFSRRAIRARAALLGSTDTR